MTRNLTREELYEPVRSKPKTHVDKELGLSGVMVGKLCKEKAPSISAWGICGAGFAALLLNQPLTVGYG